MKIKLMPNKKTSWLTIILLVIACAAILALTGAYGIPLESFIDEPLFVDTNIEVIPINETIRQGDATFDLESLEVGDNYSVLIFNSVEGGEYISGVSFYQNGEELEYLSARRETYEGITTSYEICAIGFEPANGLENIELRILNITGVTDKEYTYPLNYKDNIAVVEAEINDDYGTITVTLDKDGVTIDQEGLKEVFKIMSSTELGYPVFPPKMILLKDGEEISNVDCSQDSPPDTLKIIVKELEKDDEIIVIPIS